MRVTVKSLERRIATIRDNFGLPPVYIILGEHASREELFLLGIALYPEKLHKKVALWGASGPNSTLALEYPGRRLTEYMSLKEMDAYLEGFTNALHFARRFVGLRRPGLHICNAWADYVLGMQRAEREEAAQNYGVEVAPVFPWKPEGPTVPFGRPQYAESCGAAR